MAKKNHILLVVRHPVGGIRTFLRYVYKNFDTEKYKLTILAPEVEELKALLSDLDSFDITHIPLDASASAVGASFRVLRVLMSKKIDLIHSHGFLSGTYASLPARLSGVKHLITVHDVLLPKQFQGVYGIIKKKVLSTMLLLTDAIHFVSNDSKQNLFEHIPKLRRHESKCHVIPNGIEVERFLDIDARPFREELNLDDDMFLIGFMGRFMSQKGFRRLIDAIEILQKNDNMDQTPVVLAFGYGGFIREDRELIEKKGLGKYFRFLPFADNVAASLHGLDVVAMPSLWEACPLLPMEALVSGTPVIGTDCLGLREVLYDTPGVVAKAGDSESLAHALLNEMESPSRGEAMAFREMAARRFNVKKQAAGLGNVILEIITDSHVDKTNL